MVVVGTDIFPTVAHCQTEEPSGLNNRGVEIVCRGYFKGSYASYSALISSAFWR